MKKIFYGWWIVLAGFIISFYVAGTIFYGFTAFLEPLVAEFGWSYAQVSFAASLRGLEMGIMAPLVGFLVDRFGSRMLMFSGIVILGGGVILLGFTQSLWMFYGAFIMMAFGAGGCTSVVTMTVIANWFEKKTGKAMGILASGFGASGLLIPLIVWLIDKYGWRTALIILGVGAWLILLPLATIIRHKPEECGYAPDGVDPGTALQNSRSRNEEITLPFRQAVIKRTFLFVNLAEMLRLMVLTTVVTHIMPYLNTMGYSRKSAGFIAASIPLVSILGRFGFGWLGDLMAKKRVMAVAYGCMGLGTAALHYAQAPGVILVFLLFFASGFGGITVLRASILREYYGRQYFGKLIGIMMGFGALGGIVGPTAAGWLFDRMQTYQHVWLSFSLLIGLAVLLVLGIEPKPRPPAPAAANVSPS